MNVQKVPEDSLINQIGALFDKIRFAEFPQLEVERVTDGGETFDALRCPRCGSLVDGEDLYAVDFSERWSPAYDLGSDDTFEHRRVEFDGDNVGDASDTVCYMHDDHAVRLPEGWGETWA